MNLDFSLYLKKNRYKLKEFAELLKKRSKGRTVVSVASLSHYKLKKRCPSLEIALLIEEVTEGQVRIKDLILKRKKDG